MIIGGTSPLWQGGGGQETILIQSTDKDVHTEHKNSS